MSTARRINTDLGFIPMKTLEQLKSNAELIVGDYVAVAETCLFYKIQSESTTIRLNNGLYANEIKHQGLTTAAKDLVGAINELKTAIETKFNKDGGTISGNLAVNGNISNTGNAEIGGTSNLTGNVTANGDITGTAAKSVSGFGKVHNPVWG